MPVFDFTSPEGKTYSVTGPDGATPEQAFAMLQQHLGGPAPAAAPTPEPVSTNQIVRSAAEGIPIVGGAVKYLNAATNATLAPIVDPLLPDSYDKLKEPTWGGRFSHALKSQEQQSAQFEKEHPVASTAAGLAGGIAATGGLATTSLGAKALGLGGSTMPGMVARGAASGAAIGAADALVRGDDVSNAAKVGGVVGALAPVAGRAVGAAVNRFIPSNVPTANELGASALKALQDARKAGVEVSGSALGRLGSDIESALHKDAFRDYLAPKTFAAIKEMSAAPAGAVATLDDLHGMRRVLGQAARDFSNPTEQAAASSAIKALDNYIANVPTADVVAGDPAKAAKLFKDFLGDYAAKKRAELVGTKLEQAQLRAAGTHSGANVDNATRQKVLSILNSPKLAAQFSQEEREQMRRVVEGGATTNALRWIGNLLGGGGGLGHMLTGAAGFMAAGPAGVAAPLAGVAARKAASSATMRQARLLDEIVRSRSTLGSTAIQPNRDEINRAAMQIGSVASRGLAPQIPFALDGVYPSNMQSPALLR